MASSRAMRRASRRPSPLRGTTQDKEEQNNGFEEEKKETHPRFTDTGEWIEPEVPPMKVSTEEWPGINKSNTVDWLQPLGTMPAPKVYTRFKEPTSTRAFVTCASPERGGVKATIAKKVIGRGRKTTEPREKMPLKASSKTNTRASLGTKIKEDEDEYNPNGMELHSTPHEPPSSSSRLQKNLPQPPMPTDKGREALRAIVDQAVVRAREVKNEPLGLAIQKMFDESLKDRNLAQQLDAVLGQRASERQILDFQTYIRMAKKQFKAKAEEDARKAAESTVSTNSTSFIIKHGDAEPRAHLSLQSTKRTPVRPSPSVVPQKRSITVEADANGTSTTNEQPPVKRSRHSRSPSPFSELSDLGSKEPSMEPSLEPENVSEDNSKPVSNNRTQTKQATAKRGRDKGDRWFKPTIHPDKLHLSYEVSEKKRRKLRQSFDDVVYEESGIRGSLGLSTSLAGMNMTTESTQTPSQSIFHSQNGADDPTHLHSPASSGQGDLLVPPPPGARRQSSRQATPSALGRVVRQARKTARVKQSPMKKRMGPGVVAGIQRASGGRNSPVGYDQMGDNGEHENVDYCTACGGSGELLCCDGCPRSFHFTCLDPPEDPTSPPRGEWFCHVCEANQKPHSIAEQGVFSGLQSRIEQRNPVAFNLPLQVRDHYEGVRTGEEGEYEDEAPFMSKIKAGANEYPETIKLYTPSGQLKTCFHCGGTSQGRREIISCDYCPHRWHLDCVDPPLAVAPKRHGGKVPWKCPAHLDASLMEIAAAQAAERDGGRVIKIRRPKNAKIVQSVLRRGVVASIQIDVENEPDPELRTTEFEDSFGVIHQVPEKGLKLDFIDRVKRATTEQLATFNNLMRQQQLQHGFDVSNDEWSAELAKRPPHEREAALNLAWFATHHKDLNLGDLKVGSLNFGSEQVETLTIDALISALIQMVNAEERLTNSKEVVHPGPSKNWKTAVNTRSSTKGRSKTSTPTGKSQDRNLSPQARETLVKVQELIRRRLEDEWGEEDDP
ncbi:MAG: hypothetical protein MMC33_004599 [Icmadophila ericetorum]|nr:hypothetical protein [Icmadophila ericetorum]